MGTQRPTVEQVTSSVFGEKPVTIIHVCIDLFTQKGDKQEGAICIEGHPELSRGDVEQIATECGANLRKLMAPAVPYLKLPPWKPGRQPVDNFQPIAAEALADFNASMAEAVFSRGNAKFLMFRNMGYTQ